MEKAKIIKALEICSNGTGNCAGCQYEGCESVCCSELAKNSLSLLKATETPKPKYPMVYIYTKKGNLLSYMTGKVMGEMHIKDQATSDRIHEYYKREREIQLIAMFRWEGSKCFCKIKCPVNPLPVKGEFEIPSIGVVEGFLRKEGWAFKQKFYPRMFQ